MKKIYILSLALILPVLILALTVQQSDFIQKLGTTNALLDRGVWRLTERIYHYQGMSGWEPNEKLTYHYGDNFITRPDSVKLWIYTGYLRTWFDSGKVVYTYNGQGYITQAMMYERYEDEFIPVNLLTAEYDAQHRLVHMYFYYTDSPGREWYPMLRWHLVYNSNSDYVVYVWESGGDGIPPTWYKNNFVWDTQGRIIEEVEQSSADSLAWENSYKVEHTYHPADTSTGDDFVSWIALYLPMSFTVFNEGGLPMMTTLDLDYDWYGSWELSERSVSTYTSTAPYLLLTMLDEYYESGNWEPDYRTEFTYDTNNNQDEQIEYWWDWYEQQWYEGSMSTFSWEYMNVASDDPNVPATLSLSLNAYPNPFSDGLTLGAESKNPAPVSYEVFNLKGQLVFTATAPAQQKVEWNGLDRMGRNVGSGIYLVKASQHGNSSISKVLKMK